MGPAYWVRVRRSAGHRWRLLLKAVKQPCAKLWFQPVCLTDTMARKSPESGTVAQNRRARFDYFIDEKIEAGIILHGTEVKSLRQGQASLSEAWAGPREGDLWLNNCYIPEYGNSAHFNNHEVRRPRKLLLHKREIQRLSGAANRQGVTIVPMSIYFNDRGIAKVLLGLARGKRQVDKRQTTKDRDWQRQKARVMRERGR